MRILHVNKFYPPHLGGVEFVVQEITEGFAEEMEIDVLVCHEKKGSTNEQVEGNVRIVRARSWGTVLRMPISFDFFVRYREMVKKADIVLVHHPFPLGFLAAAFFGRSKPLFVFYHSDIVKQKIAGLLIKPLLNRVFTQAKGIFVTSKNLCRYSEILKSYREKCIVTPLWVQTEKFTQGDFSESSRLIRRKYGSPLVLGVGRLVYYKGFQYLIRAMKSLSAHLLIIGNGPLKKELNALIADLKIQDRVSIIDPVEDLAPYFHACDIFAFPSTHPSEAFGLVQLEAMLCEKPIVNTLLPSGVPEVSVDRKTGLTVEPADTKALTLALHTLLKNKEIALQLGKQGKEHAMGYKKETTLEIIKQAFTKAL
jgi:glycosyltransferase involved in cell wall biosynthesis